MSKIYKNLWINLTLKQQETNSMQIQFFTERTP